MLTANIVINSGVLNDDGTLNGTPQITWTPIGGFNRNGKDYSGEFNGNGHTISGLYFNNGEVKNVGLFGKTASGAYIHDLGVNDSYFYGKDHVGGICGDFANGLIENCWSEVSICVTSGDGGGLTGSVFTNAVLKDCYSTCIVNGSGNCGFVCGALTGRIENCYAYRINIIIETTNAIGWISPDGLATNVEIKNAAAFASGEVCYKLNNGLTGGTQKWYQTLGSDNFPVLDSSHGTVYYGYDGGVLTYSNSPLDNSITYIDADDNPQTADNVTVITNSSSTLDAGWYIVSGTDVRTGTLTCNGAVHLILADGAQLTATGGDNQAGIIVSGDGNSLAIYGQTAQSGQLIANGRGWSAGIGGGEYGSGSNITINGGTVTANGGQLAAGIGGGRDSYDSNNITINGGVVTATGGQFAAGIGGGANGSGSDITINGGTVTANGGFQGAGIGGGDGYGGVGMGIIGGNGSNITINGGVVMASGGAGASCIGKGNKGEGNNIFVAAELIVRADNNNPPTTVVAPDHTDTTDIANDLNGISHAIIGAPQGGIVTYGDYITVSPEFASGDHIDAFTQVTFTAADRWAENHEFLGFYKESTFENKITNGVNGNIYTVLIMDGDISVYAKYEQFTPVPYVDADGNEQGGTKTAVITAEASTLNAGWYVVTGEVSSGPLTCNGAVHLILADGAKLTANGGWAPGITVSGNGNSLTIYGQTAQSGQLIANGGNYGAGIGGYQWNAGSNITINGGIITANGSTEAAGIGGGAASGFNITINGGTVTANGGADGAGIGGAHGGAGYNITITGGTVTANGGADGAGIGGGSNGSASNITITGGTVTANGGKNASGIGGGSNGSASNIKVATELIVRANYDTNPPISEILHTTDYDIAGTLNGKRYATVKDEMTDGRADAIAAINAAIEDVANEDIIAFANNAIEAINETTTLHEIEIIKNQALAAIALAKSIYNSGLGEMEVPCDDCPAVDVTKGTTTIRLYSPEKVEFKKTE